MAEKNKDIVGRAQRRFAECVTWEQEARNKFKDDIRFLYADSDNHEQWNAQTRAQRQLAGQPMLTINKTHTHWLHVVNQAKMNKPAIKVSPTGDEATFESAQVYAQVIKRIEDQSKAVQAYMKAAEFMVGGGIGYWRIITQYTDENSFDQEIYIRPIPDPLTVYLDPNIKEKDGSDAKFGFLFEELDKEEAEKKYGNILKSQVFGQDALSWYRKNSLRIAEYFEREEGYEWLYAVQREDGSTHFVRESELPDGAGEMKAALREAYDRGEAQRRRVKKHTVRWYKLVGNEIVDKGVWAGKYIPIVRVAGEEVVIEGRLDRKGIVRYLKDAQRSYNYNASAAIEFGALQSKSPYLAPVEAIEGLENYWATANTQNHAYLPWNHADESGNPIPRPERQQPPVGATVFMEGMQTAEHEMMMASGQYEATFSDQGNEISGISIQQRQEQGERVTFHYLDSLADAVQYTGIQLIDLIPKVYDTKRVLRIMAEGGKEHIITIDPQQKQALQKQESQSQAQVASIFNPSVGNYDVTADSGPNFQTRRKEAFAAMTGMLKENPALAQVIGDLFMGNADFPVSDELQERMRNWIKITNPGVLGEGPTPQEQQMQQQLQQATQFIHELQMELADKSVQQQLEKQRLDMDALNHLALRMENERQDMVNAFKAETERLKLTAPAMTPEQFEEIVKRQLGEIMTARAPGEDLNRATMDPSATLASGLPTIEPMPQPQPESAPQSA
jgi:hypothetical protein